MSLFYVARLRSFAASASGFSTLRRAQLSDLVLDGDGHADSPIIYGRTADQSCSKGFACLDDMAPKALGFLVIMLGVRRASVAVAPFPYAFWYCVTDMQSCESAAGTRHCPLL